MSNVQKIGAVVALLALAAGGWWALSESPKAPVEAPKPPPKQEAAAPAPKPAP